MDPLSIIASVSAASRVALALSTTLFGFVQATRNVDQSVRGLYDEVTGLNTVLDAIGNSVQVASTGKGKQPVDSRLWQSVATSLDHCCETVGRMQGTIQNMQKPSSNFVGQAIRVLKLNWSEDQVKTLRSQIQTHNTALQLALQVINVHLASAAPRLVTDDLVPRIEILTDMVRQLSQAQISSAPPVYESKINISVTAEQTNIANLMVSAQNVLSEAKSVVARSEDGSAHSSSVATILHRLDSLELEMEDSITVIQGSHPPKPPQPNVERDGAVENWIPTLPSRNDDTDLDSSSVATRTQMTPTQSSRETASIASAYSDSATADDYSDDDDDFEYELLRSFFETGFFHYTGRKWANADRFLRHGIDASRRLPPDKLHEKNVMLDEAQFRFAICAFHQKKFEDAEVPLFKLRTTRPTVDEKREVTLRRMLATYVFALLCLCRNQLDEAHKHCRKAFAMKRKHFDKEMFVLDSVYFQLLVEVATARADTLTAEVCSSKVAEFKAKHAHALQHSREQDLLVESSEWNMAQLWDLLDISKVQRNKIASDEKPEHFTHYNQAKALAMDTTIKFYVVFGVPTKRADGSPMILSSIPGVAEFKKLSLDFLPGSFKVLHLSLNRYEMIVHPSFGIYGDVNRTLWGIESAGGSPEHMVVQLKHMLEGPVYDPFRRTKVDVPRSSEPYDYWPESLQRGP